MTNFDGYNLRCSISCMSPPSKFQVVPLVLKRVVNNCEAVSILRACRFYFQSSEKNKSHVAGFIQAVRRFKA